MPSLLPVPQAVTPSPSRDGILLAPAVTPLPFWDDVLPGGTALCPQCTVAIVPVLHNNNPTALGGALATSIAISMTFAMTHVMASAFTPCHGQVHAIGRGHGHAMEL